MLVCEYPRWWNTTVVVYHRHVNSKTEITTYVRGVYRGCFWQDGKETKSTQNADIEKPTITVRLPAHLRPCIDTGDIIARYCPGDAAEDFDKLSPSDKAVIINRMKSMGVPVAIAQDVRDNSNEAYQFPHFKVRCL